ncbi:hypothetical protein CEXT_596541 [Caerostris extrusa]|uniref:Uncharacterized protein n=1 Tax=Caerostris extrusa TaxID=172846 RepID=A0AAV4PUA7_CAEEX|nr:hypothetical protein CEXT_596541 [Caerostris extrusa]
MISSTYQEESILPKSWSYSISAKEIYSTNFPKLPRQNKGGIPKLMLLIISCNGSLFGATLHPANKEFMVISSLLYLWMPFIQPAVGSASKYVLSRSFCPFWMFLHLSTGYSVTNGVYLLIVP